MNRPSSRIFAFTLSFKSTVTKQVRTFHSSSYTLIPPSSSTGTISSHYPCPLHLHHTLQQSSCGFRPDEQFQLLKKSHHRLHFTGSGILDFLAHLNDYSEVREYDTLLCNTHVPPLTYRRRPTFTGSARVTCTAATRVQQPLLTFWTRFVITLFSQRVPSLTSDVNTSAYKIPNNFAVCSNLWTQQNPSTVQRCESMKAMFQP